MRTSVLCVLLVLAGCGSSDDEGRDASMGDAEIPTPGPPGPPGCGLAAAAFCDPFDAPSSSGDRAGELGPLWSGARTTPTLPAGGDVIAIRPATLPLCRVGLPAAVLPDQDTLICDTISSLQSNHLLVAAAAQNYGQNSYRIRRPFDVAARTGTITFDASLEPGGLLGWVAVAVTAEPTPAPSYNWVQNDENAGVPRDGIEIHFNQNCQVEGQVSVNRIIVIDDYVQTFIEPSFEERGCVPMLPGALNRVEVRLSTSHVEVWGSPASTDGITFGPLERMAAADIALPFTRGYVHLTAHNHATLKYSDETVDAWVVRFDNVGFDGPVIERFREAEVPDSRTAGSDGSMNVGYLLGDLATDDWGDPLDFSSIDVTGATTARIALTAWIGLGEPRDYVLNYRINGGTAHTYRLDAEQLAFIDSKVVQGTMPFVLEVDPSELHSGVNSIAFATTDVPMAYPPIAYNVELVVEVP